MIERQLKTANEMHTVPTAPKRLCAGKSYWATLGFTPNNEQDPIKRASLYKESGN